ncbi:DNA (cytosine-5)-methyltransferase 1 [Microvirga flocculans]|uniref:Cytosine-specific methyltransferase n=1 Tax=Microvirga flocculans TaxID=217168 RepID=A0A7W6N9L5_9HYPH|nr:DNA cytosine methyltransferase [Microvirga flocculans]MBB4041625.1 DNA (cytosine-5)-methyltransferase 1 [Microvirga flocculans]
MNRPLNLTEAQAVERANYDVARIRPSKQKRFEVISLFSGCGGMDLGFRGGFSFLGKKYARHPFDIVWANDLNEVACRTYRRNLGSEVHHGDIWQLIERMPSTADIVIGGFPCQDISVNGKGRGVDGARSGLYRAMVQVVRNTKPLVFVAENVKGLLNRNNQSSLKRVIDDFSSLGYDLSVELYHAASYGVPQSRERVFIVGTLPSVPKFQPPKPILSEEEWVTAETAISDLEAAEWDERFSHIWSMAKRSPEQGNRKLRADRAAYTIRAECHGNIQWHYSLNRRISMREAARIQSFPDDFIFDAKLRETERQIGNAVPPVLAWHVANAVKKLLK